MHGIVFRIEAFDGGRKLEIGTVELKISWRVVSEKHSVVLTPQVICFAQRF
jgi:hypothetical protein